MRVFSTVGCPVLIVIISPMLYWWQEWFFTVLTHMSCGTVVILNGTSTCKLPFIGRNIALLFIITYVTLIRALITAQYDDTNRLACPGDHSWWLPACLNLLWTCCQCQRMECRQTESHSINLVVEQTTGPLCRVQWSDARWLDTTENCAYGERGCMRQFG